jgi:hypothetical protein
MELEGVVLLVFVGGSTLLASAAVVLSAVFLSELSRLERMRRRRDNPRLDYLTRLLRGVAKRSIKDIGDLYKSYRAFFGVAALRASHLEEIADFLRRATVRIPSAPPGRSDAPSHEDLQVLLELLAANRRALEVEQQCVPFSGTPEAERQLLEDILKLAGEDTSRVRPKLDGLAMEIRIRQDTVERLGWESGRSLKLARWGWFGTVAFSILSVILGILIFGG